MRRSFQVNAGVQGMLALAGIYDRRLDPTKPADDPTRWLLTFATPLAPIHERNPLLLSESTMTEWLDPSNLEDPENTTQDMLDELSYESDQVAAQVEFWPVGVEVGNVRNQTPNLISRLL